MFGEIQGIRHFNTAEETAEEDTLYHTVNSILNEAAIQSVHKTAGPAAACQIEGSTGQLFGVKRSTCRTRIQPPIAGPVPSAVKAAIQQGGTRMGSQLI